MPSTPNEIATYELGTGDDAAVDAKIALAWAELLKERRAEIAKQLGVAQDRLQESEPPFRARTKAGGFGVVEVAIILGTAFSTAFAKELGTKAGRATADAIWRYLEKWMQNPKDPVLGRRKDQDH